MVQPMVRKYRVVRLSRISNEVEMTLSEISESLPPPKIPLEQKIDLKRVIKPMPKTDDEHVVVNFLEAVKKFAPQLIEPLEDMTSNTMVSVYPAVKSLVNVTMILSLEEYKLLESPALEDILEFTIKKLKNKG